MAVFANEPAMLEAYRSDQDLHAITAANSRGYTLEEFQKLKDTDPKEYKKLRFEAKAENFGFLYNPLGRWLFLIFVSVLCSRLGILGYASIAAIGSSQLLYTYIMCKYPKYETYMRKMHYANISKK